MSDENGAYFLKKYDRLTVLEKVKIIHEALCSIDFQYVQPVKIDLEKGHFRQQWVDGIVANYQVASHRKQVYKMLQALHATNERIDWQAKNFKRLILKKKWQARLEKFKSYESVIREFIQQDFDMIYDWAEEALSEVRPIENTEEPTLLHGDVAHHNFFVGAEPLMIDFDLAIIGPSIYEEIMFAQRVLPMMRYDWLQLVRELPNLKKLARYNKYLCFPNELLREWCYFASSSDAEQAKIYFYIRKLTLDAKRNRSSFLHQLKLTNSSRGI